MVNSRHGTSRMFNLSDIVQQSLLAVEKHMVQCGVCDVQLGVRSTVSHSSSLLWGTFFTDCKGSLGFLLLLWVVFTETLSVNLCTLGPCEVVVAGNWACEIAYLQTSSLAWLAKGNSKHIQFLSAVFFSLFLSSWAWKLLLSV